MNLSYVKIEEIFPQFNKIALTENDFWTQVKTNRIYVRVEPLLVDGYYEKKKRKHSIVLNCELRGVRFLHTAFHELFHFFLDGQFIEEDEEITLFRSQIQIKTSRELIADALALIAVLPMPELEKLMREDLTENPYLMNLVRDRIAVLAIHKK